MRRFWTRAIIAFLSVPVLAAATCDWRVMTGPRGLCASFAIGGDRDTMFVGESLALSVQGCDVRSIALRWTSSDTRVATVDRHGVVHALSAGTVAITAFDPERDIQGSVTLVVLDSRVALRWRQQVEGTACERIQSVRRARSIPRGGTIPRSPIAS
ncbi:MAG TPA: Ig-like domain-containing protein [Gemmatimonadaceae bacterium]|nr:Ig-like domain-containing protein [Gemmatimonadaceae bacterium]